MRGWQAGGGARLTGQSVLALCAALSCGPGVAGALGGSPQPPLKAVVSAHYHVPSGCHVHLAVMARNRLLCPCREVKNSWSTHWGERGYFRVSRNVRHACGVPADAAYALVS